MRVATLNGVDVYRNTRALPRAFLVGQLRAVPDKTELFKAMVDPEYDPTRVALVQELPKGKRPDTQSDNLGRATVRERTSMRVVADVDATEDCYLILSDTYYPGWKATIDAKPVDIFPVYYAFRGIVLPAGKHVVEYTYSPESFEIGLTISLVTMACAALGSLYLLLRRFRASANGG